MLGTCTDHENGTECCTVLDIPFIKDHPRACINLTMEEEGEKMVFYLTWDAKVVLHGSLIDFTKPVCAQVPIPVIGQLVQLCVKFSDIEQVQCYCGKYHTFYILWQQSLYVAIQLLS